MVLLSLVLKLSTGRAFQIQATLDEKKLGDARVSTLRCEDFLVASRNFMMMFG